MDDMILVTMLENLMDNTLTTTENSIQEAVFLTTTFRHGFDMIVLANNCDMIPKSTGSHLQSSKTGKCFQGIGLKNVSGTLRKYHGDFNWKYDEEKYIFTETAMLGKWNEI